MDNSAITGSGRAINKLQDIVIQRLLHQPFNKTLSNFRRGCAIHCLTTCSKVLRKPDGSSRQLPWKPAAASQPLTNFDEKTSVTQARAGERNSIERNMNDDAFFSFMTSRRQMRKELHFPSSQPNAVSRFRTRRRNRLGEQPVLARKNLQK